MKKSNTTFLLLHSQYFPDISSFLELFSILLEPEFLEKEIGKGEKSATFEVFINEDELELKQDFGQNKIQLMLNEIQILKLENKALKEELKSYEPRQDLSVNETLKSAIYVMRKEGLSFQKIANNLNEKGYKNSRGNPLDAMQTSRLYKKYLIEN